MKQFKVLTIANSLSLSAALVVLSITLSARASRCGEAFLSGHRDSVENISAAGASVGSSANASSRLIDDFWLLPSHPITKALHSLSEENFQLRVSRFEPDRSAPMNVQAKQILNLIINEQMSRLDEVSKAEINATVSGGRIVAGEVFNGFVESFGGTLFDIHLPQIYHGTPIEGYIIVHEREHLRQGAVLRRLFEREPSLKTIDKKEALQIRTEIRFFDEIGAMALEYYYLKTLTPETRRWMAAELEKNPHLIGPDGNARPLYLVLRSPFFSHPAASARTYVYAQWRLNRYTLDQIRAEERIKRGLPASP